MKVNAFNLETCLITVCTTNWKYTHGVIISYLHDSLRKLQSQIAMPLIFEKKEGQTISQIILGRI